MRFYKGKTVQNRYQILFFFGPNRQETPPCSWPKSTEGGFLPSIALILSFNSSMSENFEEISSDPFEMNLFKLEQAKAQARAQFGSKVWYDETMVTVKGGHTVTKREMKPQYIHQDTNRQQSAPAQNLRWSSIWNVSALEITVLQYKNVQILVFQKKWSGSFDLPPPLVFSRIWWWWGSIVCLSPDELKSSVSGRKSRVVCF